VFGQGEWGSCSRAQWRANVALDAEERLLLPERDIRTPLAVLPGTRAQLSRVTCTSTNIREVPEPEKMPDSGLTSL
jgi:hypothetical protein